MGLGWIVIAAAVAVGLACRRGMRRMPEAVRREVQAEHREFRDGHEAPPPAPAGEPARVAAAPHRAVPRA